MRIHLHLGVHKTASTWQQQALRANIDTLKQYGTRYLPLEAVRDWLTGRLMAINPTEFSFEAELQERFGLTKRINQLVLSDENLLGSCGSLMRSGVLYERAALRLERLAQLLAGHEVEVYLSVRHHADFLASAYCEALQGMGKFVPFKTFHERLQWDSLSWPRLVSTILETLKPNALYLWRYEDFRRNSADILGRLAFQPPQALAMPENTERASPSQACIDFLAFAGERLDLKTAGKLVKGIASVAPRSAGYPSFNPWSEEERAALTARYADEVAALPAYAWLVAPPDRALAAG